MSNVIEFPTNPETDLITVLERTLAAARAGEISAAAILTVGPSRSGRVHTSAVTDDAQRLSAQAQFLIIDIYQRLMAISSSC